VGKTPGAATANPAPTPAAPKDPTGANKENKSNNEEAKKPGHVKTPSGAYEKYKEVAR